MFLRKVHIHNVRSIRELRLDFLNPDGSPRKWTMILGENGCGKSTVLRALALALAGSDALPQLLGNDPDSWIHYGKDEAFIEVEIQTAEGENRKIKLQLRSKTGISAHLNLNRESLGLLDAAIVHSPRNYLTMGYGASRRLNTDMETSFKSLSSLPRARAVATLFSPDAMLEPLESWVIEMDYQGETAGIKGIIEQLVRDLLPNMKYEGIDKRKKQLMFKTPDGISPLRLLSDGYQNVTAWCGDLLRSITTIFGDYKDPLKARGFLLVDEIDLHLHPIWQRRLRAFFDKTFPNLQFLVTTHSPLTVQQAGEGELFVMQRKSTRSSPSIEAFEGAPNTMMIHQLLLSPIFNLESMDSLKVQKKREQYRTLKKKPAKSEQDKKKLKSLTKSLTDLPDMAAGLSRYEQEHVQVLEKIRSDIKSQS